MWCITFETMSNICTTTSATGCGTNVHVKSQEYTVVLPLDLVTTSWTTAYGA